MKRLTQSTHSITDVFVYSLMGLFALAGVLVALLGAQAYRTVAESAQANTESRLPAAFVRTLVRSADSAGAVLIEDNNGIATLALSEDYDGTEYLTRVYCLEGELRTSMTEAGEAFDPYLGDTVCAVGDFVPAWEGNLFTAHFTYADGETEDITVYLSAAHE